jgi:hypothetical protein
LYTLDQLSPPLNVITAPPSLPLMIRFGSFGSIHRS